MAPCQEEGQPADSLPPVNLTSYHLKFAEMTQKPNLPEWIADVDSCLFIIYLSPSQKLSTLLCTINKLCF
jgi:hypothetical protein